MPTKPLYYYFQREGSIVHSGIAQLGTLHWTKAYGVDDNTIDIICMIYVYRCGKLLETAIMMKETEKFAF